ncbi:MAG: hypothetical protein VX549_04615 [Pseudomonadota bacterium]|nr:hypothetical protein [Pseudomonadota bacterium]
MHPTIPQRVRDIAEIVTDAGHTVFGTAAELFWVEVDALSGHRSALRERLDVLRSSESASDMLTRQVDLLPESARRLRRTRMERQHTLSKFSDATRELGWRLRQSLRPSTPADAD